MARGKLNIPDGQRVSVFRTIVAWLQADKVLGQCIKAEEGWKVFSGNPNDASPLPVTAFPVIRLFPAPGPMRWITVESMESPLYINIECSVPGLHADDVLNLQEAIENALYPSDPAVQSKREQILQQPPNGCLTGRIEFMMPLWDQNGQDRGKSGNWFPIGQIRIDIRRILVH